MTLYSTNYGNASPTVNSFLELVTGLTKEARVVFMNRESTYAQNHAKNLAELQAAHKALGITMPFSPHLFYGSGCLRFLWDKGKRGRYFHQLRQMLQTELQQTQGTLYIVAPTLQRLFRSFDFDPHDKRTWEHTDRDSAMFADWLAHHFKGRDIILVPLHSGTPEAIRALETTLGIHCLPKGLQAEVLSLNAEGLNAAECYRILVQRGHKIPGTPQNKIRLFRKWIRRKGNPARRGNPRKRAKN